MHLADEPVEVGSNKLGGRVRHGGAGQPAGNHHHRQNSIHGMLQEAENQLSIIVFSA